MLKLVIIGSRADILPFRAMGAELLEADDTQKAIEILEELKLSGDSLMVMMTEQLVNTCREQIYDFRMKTSNMFLSIPSLKSKPGSRLEEIRTLVTRALGVDLLSDSK